MELDRQAELTYGDRTNGANASAHLKRFVWYPGTPGFVGFQLSRFETSTAGEKLAAFRDELLELLGKVELVVM